MIVIPAIDIRQGNAVRLTQGKIENETIYSKDPAFIAKLFKAKGARRLHVVDLDGAFNGSSQNREIISKICKAVDIPVQVGGGIRSMQTIDDIFKLGASYVILGTVAIYNPDIVREAVQKYKEKIIVAVDAKDGKVAIGGWKEVSSVLAVDLVKQLKAVGVEEILYTDIAKDGMLLGPNLNALKEIAETSKMRVIASGGVSSIEDIQNIAKLEPSGVFAAIVGKAIYSDTLNLEEAIKITQKKG
jgi:phosphoribosylformimino-5-aminoimidazole carboxamide ribotide isomerase